MHIHDLIGIGFGPSNLALAIALQEQQAQGGTPVDALFIEKQPRFAWHPHMLLDHAHMQISFLKDLATLRSLVWAIGLSINIALVAMAA